MTDTTPVIRARGLTKVFGRVRALDGLDLTVRPGEVHGFLGPNGSGKSTTIRVLLGLMKPTSGHVELFGGILGATGPACTAGWPTSPATSRSGRD